ncbi:MAG: hypothetical protein HYY15_03330 [Candidatus Omnitrophica bacterium]|nr:hypothetical protein [Candidatus Omnitrophota bacterium]
MRRRRSPSRALARLAACSALLLAAGGCRWSYSPVRRPSSTLWVAAPNPSQRIQLPSRAVTEYPLVVREGPITVGVDIVDAVRSREYFGADLLRRGIQPLLLVVANDGDRPYALPPAFVSARIVPAQRASAYASQTVAGRVGRHIQWLAFFVPGLVFSSVIEPLTTLDFPGIQDASARPVRSANREIRQDFVSHELAPGPIEPGAARSGVVYVRRLPSGSILTLSLNDPQGGEPLQVRVPLPLEPVDAQWHVYAASKDDAWKAVAATAAKIGSWRVLATDPDAGTIRVQKGVRWLGIGNRMQITLMVQPQEGGRVQVGAQTELPGGQAASVGASRSLQRFFTELDLKLAPWVAPEPPPEPAAPQAGR